MIMQSRPIRVLLINDDEDDYIVVRDLLSDLSSMEFILKWVSGYEAALDAILSSEFDVCLLDYRIKDRNGLELMQEAVDRDIITPMVFLTSQGDHDLDLEAMGRGAADCLHKGELSAALLERSIRHAMERQRKKEERTAEPAKVNAQLRKGVEERKRAEFVLEEESIGWRILFEQSRDGILVLDENGRVYDANLKYAEMLGYTMEEFRDLHVWDWDAQWTRKELEESIRLVDASGHHFETRHRRKDGTVFDVEISVNSADFAGHKLLFSVCRDISQRKAAENALRDSECRYRTFFEQGMDGVVIINPGTAHFIEFNDQICQQLGYSREEFARLSLHEIEAFATSEEIDAHSRKVEREGFDRFETRHRTKQGEIRHIDVMAQSLKVAGSSVHLCVWRDMTEQKQFNEKMLEQERKYRVLFDAANDGIFLSDGTGFVDCNQRGADMHGLAREDVIGRSPADLSPERQPDGRLSSEVAAEKILAALNGEPQSFQWQSLRSDGLIWDAEIALNRVEIGGSVLLQALVRDITDRKRAQEAVRKSEAVLRSLLEATPVGVGLLVDRVFVKVNAALCRVTGYSEQEMVGMSTRILYPDDEAFIRVGRELYEQMGKTDLGVLESCLKRKDGAIIDVLLCLSPLDPMDAAAGVTATVLDITERKRAENELRETERKLRTLVDNIPDGIARFDANCRHLLVNLAIAKDFGVTPEHFIGKTVLESHAPENDAPHRVLESLIKRVFEEGTANSVELQCVTLEGSRYRDFLHVPERDESGKVVSVLGITHDITERKRAEEQLKASESMLRSVFRATPVGIAFTVDRAIMSVNDSMCELTGYSEQELVGKSVRQLYQTQDEYEYVARELYSRIMEKGRTSVEARIRRKDGTTIYVILTAAMLRAEDPSAGRIVTIQDITERKLAEKEREALEGRLRQAQKLEAIGTLAGGIAHDFNNILTPIIGYTELALTMVQEEDRLSHNMRQILLSANRAKDLVTQILTFSRKTKQEHRPVQVSLIIKEALKMLRSSLPSTIEIRQAIDVDAMDSATMADPTHVHQVLMNLCTNAAHAMRAKGGTLTISMENVEIGQRTGRQIPDMEPGPYLMLSVADTGHGMDETLRQRIFDPYFTTKGPDEGTGLGLAVVYGIVKSLSGAIAVSSEPGKGANFDVYFPRVKKIQGPATELSEPLPTGHGRILVVDDEKSIVDLVKEMLETLGYEAVPRYSSSDAIEAFRARPESFDLVITDMTMPHMTGIDLAKEILLIRPHTSIILCTGFSDTVDKNEMKLLGVKELLMKPVSMRDMAVAVNKILLRDRLLS